jgi:hypothetical protein
MARVENSVKNHPSSQTLLAQGEFWFSLQLSGMPLLFAQPPKVISFTNGNFEYYGYDGRDLGRTTAQVGDFPLGHPSQTDAWTKRLTDFYRDEFTTLPRARTAFLAVVARNDDPEAKFRALLFLQALGGGQFDALAGHEFDGLPLVETFRTTCEDYKDHFE